MRTEWTSIYLQRFYGAKASVFAWWMFVTDEPQKLRRTDKRILEEETERHGPYYWYLRPTARLPKRG
jgi:hypothetical protein